MEARAHHYLTEEQYWALDETAPIKYEYYGGRIYAMSGGSPTHAVIASNLIIALGTQLRGRQCRVVGSDQRVIVEATGLQTYPDVVVYCNPSRFYERQKDTLTTPVLIVEVLSPSTEPYDRTTKLDNYKQMPSLQHYLLVAQDQVRVEHFQRHDNADWLLYTATSEQDILELRALDCTIGVGDIYDSVAVAASPPVLRTVEAPDV